MMVYSCDICSRRWAATPCPHSPNFEPPVPQWAVGDRAVRRDTPRDKPCKHCGRPLRVPSIEDLNGRPCPTYDGDCEIARRKVVVREWEQEGTTCWSDRPPLGAEPTGRSHEFYVEET